MKLLISGICGHMGKEAAALATGGFAGITLAAGVDIRASGSEPVPTAKSFSAARRNVDCVVDFSHHSATEALLDFVTENSLPLVLATTGQTDAEKSRILQASERIPLFLSANYSLGMALITQFARQAAEMMPEAEIEIIEVHHDRKTDAPSGTALAIADQLMRSRPCAYIEAGRSGHGKRDKDQIGIHSVRIGDVIGTHTVMIGTKSETVTLRHEAHSRTLFAEGALTAACFLAGKKPGLYGMDDLVAQLQNKRRY